MRSRVRRGEIDERIGRKVLYDIRGLRSSTLSGQELERRGGEGFHSCSQRGFEHWGE